MRGLRSFIAAVVLFALSACSLSITTKPTPSPSSGNPRVAALEGKDGSKVGSDPKATPGDAEIQGSEFRLYTGNVWIGFTAPNGYKVSKDENGGVKLVGLASGSDPRTNIMFSRLTSVKNLPSTNDLTAQMRAKQLTNIEARHDIQNLGDFKAVAAQATVDTGYVAIVSMANFKGYVWTATINAPDAATADELLKAIRAVKPVKAGSRTSPGSSSSRHTESLGVQFAGQRYTVDVNGAKIVTQMPQGFVPSQAKGDGVVGFEDGRDKGRNVTFYIDTTGFTTDANQVRTKSIEVSPDIDGARALPDIHKIAGYPAAGVAITTKNGTMSRLYIVNVKGVMIQLIVNFGTAKSEDPALVKVVEDATS